MSRVAKELNQLQYGAESVVTAAETVDDDDVWENWYYWSERSAATRGPNDLYASESITTVYAVKTAVSLKRRKGWLIHMCGLSSVYRIAVYSIAVRGMQSSNSLYPRSHASCRIR